MASYKGITITPGTDASVAAQVAAIDAKAAGGSTGAAGGSAGGNTSTAATTTPDPSSSDFLTQLQKSLIAQSGIVSSSNSNIENSIGSAITGLKDGNTAADAAVSDDYDTKFSQQQNTNNNSTQQFEEGRSGYATPVVAFAALRDYNSKTIADLEKQKQAAILANDSATATSIANLQVQKLQFEQQAAQNTFSNLIQTGNLSINAKQLQDSEATQTFQESQAMASVALQYGVTVKPGDTLADVVARATPNASKAQQLQLAQMQAQINASNATTAKALSDAKSDNATLSAAQISALAAAYGTPAGASIIASQVKNPSMLAAIFGQASANETNLITSNAQASLKAGTPLATVIAGIQSNGNLQNPTAAIQAATQVYADAPEKPKAQSFFDSSSGTGLLSNFINTLVAPPKK